MCGIGGFQGLFEASLLDRMNAAQAHRGPDGFGAWVSTSDRGGTRTGLAHRRLSIIDLSAAGRQPMSVNCERCGAHGLDDLALTYNGELYNFPELRAELAARGHAFASLTDSEVLLHLYAEEGAGMLARLNGIFALALCDGRPRAADAEREPGDLLVARDQLGVKPIYLCELAAGTLFASEMKAILQDASVPRDLDHEALAEHLAYLWTPAPRTLLQSVRKLEPGSAAWLRGGRVRRSWRYYALPYGAAPLTGTPDEMAQELAQLLARAVGRQMMADVPVGAFLSGGLDSSSVVAMMQRARPGLRPVCYTIDSGDGNSEGNRPDLPYARQVARHLDVELREIRVGPAMIDELDTMLWHLDEPQADPAAINALLIARAARRDGIPVLLSGAGGDDILGGYRRHWAVRFERAWSWWPAPLRRALAGISNRAASGHTGAGQHSHALRRLSKMFAYADLPADRRLASYFWWSTESLRHGLFTQELQQRLAGIDVAAPLLATLTRMPNEPEPLNRLLALDTRHFLADHNLPYTDKMGMAASIEIRVPLLDPDLVAFAARVPPDWKQRGRFGKPLFKRAMEPVLPHDVIYRPKTGFGAPLRRWLRADLSGRLDDVLGETSLRRRGLFDPRAVASLRTMDRDGRVDGGYTIFALFCVELWCRRFIDGPLEAPARS
jgi:asparagine synthase (glutamine-hydrolysing)